MSSLACKFEFYRPEHNEKGRPMELNLTHGVQRVDNKWGHFTSAVMVIKMSKMDILYFLVMTAKN